MFEKRVLNPKICRCWNLPLVFSLTHDINFFLIWKFVKISNFFSNFFLYRVLSLSKVRFNHVLFDCNFFFLRTLKNLFFLCLWFQIVLSDWFQSVFSTNLYDCSLRVFEQALSFFKWFKRWLKVIFFDLLSLWILLFFRISKNLFHNFL